MAREHWDKSKKQNYLKAINLKRPKQRNSKNKKNQFFEPRKFRKLPKKFTLTILGAIGKINFRK